MTYNLTQIYENEETDVIEHEEIIKVFPQLPTDEELKAALNQYGCLDDWDARQNILALDTFVLLDRHDNLYGLEKVT